MKYLTFLNEQIKRAESVGLEKEAIRLLILEILELNNVEFIVKLHDEISDEAIEKLTKAIDKYIIDKIPVQYIMGYAYFYGNKLKVNENVLIPRCETEELVEYVRSYYEKVFSKKTVDIVDIGTGSGAIAISLAKNEPNMNVYATDISDDAIKVARENANINKVNIDFLVGDMLEPLIKNNIKVDIIVSNPPYIRNDDYVEDIVKNNEPHLALFGGDDGMKYYNIILSNAHKVLKEKSILAFEHSFSEKEQMIELSKKYFPNSEIISIKDLSKKDRITIIINR